MFLRVHQLIAPGGSACWWVRPGRKMDHTPPAWSAGKNIFKAVIYLAGGIMQWKRDPFGAVFPGDFPAVDWFPKRQ